MRQAILTGSILNSLSGATSGGEAEAALSLFEVTKSLLDPPSLPVPSVRAVIWASLPSGIHERCLVCSDQGSSHLHQTKVNLRPEERL